MAATGKPQNGVQQKKTAKNEEMGRPKPIKVVVRRLPGALTVHELRAQIAPLPPNASVVSFAVADETLSPWSFCRAYLSFADANDVVAFRDRFDGYVFVDSQGNESAALVEVAAFQKITSHLLQDAKTRDDKCGTFRNDEKYKSFLASLNAPSSSEAPATVEDVLIHIEQKAKQREELAKQTTPLVDYIHKQQEDRRRRRIEKIRARDEERQRRRQAEIERRQQAARQHNERKIKVKQREQTGTETTKHSNTTPAESANTEKGDTTGDNVGVDGMKSRTRRGRGGRGGGAKEKKDTASSTYEGVKQSSGGRQAAGEGNTTEGITRAQRRIERARQRNAAVREAAHSKQSTANSKKEETPRPEGPAANEPSPSETKSATSAKSDRSNNTNNNNNNNNNTTGTSKPTGSSSSVANDSTTSVKPKPRLKDRPEREIYQPGARARARRAGRAAATQEKSTTKEQSHPSSKEDTPKTEKHQ